jgi:hypothetical protein
MTNQNENQILQDFNHSQQDKKIIVTSLFQEK